jgi:hypothetical protein
MYIALLRPFVAACVLAAFLAAGSPAHAGETPEAGEAAEAGETVRGTAAQEPVGSDLLENGAGIDPNG